MRTIPAAMTWELLARGRWTLAGTQISTLAIPILLLWILEGISDLVSQARALQLIHSAALQANGFSCIVMLVAVNYSQSLRIYAYPATNSMIVAGRILPAAALTTITFVLWTATINAMFHLDWPLLEPAVMALSATVVVHATVWLFSGSIWMIVALADVAVVYSFWVKSHFGPIFGNLEHPWSPFTFLEGCALAVVTASFYGIAVIGLARHRRGEAPLSLGVMVAIQKILEHLSRGDAELQSPAKAQLHYLEHRAWLPSILVIAALAIYLVIWSFINRDPNELIIGVSLGSWFLWTAAGIGGVTLGAMGATADLAMGQLLATRPMTTADMSLLFLRTSIKSLIAAWLIWAVVLLLLLSLAWIADYAPISLLPEEFSWRTVGASILASWTAISGALSVTLIGRAKLLGKIFGGLSASGIALALAGKFALPPDSLVYYIRGVVVVCVIASVAGTLAMFIVARRWRLIKPRLVWMSLVLWIALVVIASFAIPTVPKISTVAALLLFSSLSIAVAPIAATPLALAWNRTR